MKIGQHPEIANALAQSTPAKQQARAAAPVAQAVAQSRTATQSGAPVSLSNAARGLEASSRSQGDFDADKVKAMRTAIQNGTFKINAGAIADKLLANAQEVLVRASY
ncbi:MAG: flagellar biosynthesis anti-sigma factor FlgM [Comamonadaceae bacterium]|nr:flagellar biosynthesis anti-sigma factor FlgM [Comamonadaceae bacterium]